MPRYEGRGPEWIPAWLQCLRYCDGDAVERSIDGLQDHGYVVTPVVEGGARRAYRVTAPGDSVWRVIEISTP